MLANTVLFRTFVLSRLSLNSVDREYSTRFEPASALGRKKSPIKYFEGVAVDAAGNVYGAVLLEGGVFLRSVMR